MVENKIQIFGLKGLAKLVGVSLPTAGDLYRSGKIPSYSTGTGRKLFFYEHEVVEALKTNQKQKAV